MYGPVTLKIDGEMNFYRSARRTPLAWPTTWGAGGAATTLPNFGSEKIRTKKIEKKLKFLFFVAISKTRPVFYFDHFFRRRPPGPLVPSLIVGAPSTLPKFRGPISGPKKFGPQKSKKMLKFQFLVAISKTLAVFDFDHFFFVPDPPSAVVPSLLVGGTCDSAKVSGSNFGSEKIRTKKIEKKVEILIFRRDFKNAPGFRF